MPDKSLIELIRKLSAMTTENGASETEALFAAEKIAKIKAQHNIDLEELEYDEFEAIGEDLTTNYKRLPIYLDNLMAYLAKAFNCKVIRNHKNYKINFIIVGLPHDTVMCSHFYQYLSRVLINESKGRKNKNAFCRGMIHSIIEKLMPKQDQDVSAAQKGVMVHRESAINKYIAAKIGKTVKRRVGTRRDDNAYNEGRAKGRNVSLSNPIKGRGQRQIGM